MTAQAAVETAPLQAQLLFSEFIDGAYMQTGPLNQERNLVLHDILPDVASQG